FLEALSARHDIPYVDPDVGLVDQALIAKTSIPYLIRHRILPLRIGDGALTAILADPLDIQLLQDLERIFDVPVKPCCATEAKIVAALHGLERLRDGKGDPE